MQNIVHNPSEEIPSFDLLSPEQHLTPFVFGSPHSGRFYPPSFLASSVLDERTIRKSEDFLVDELFESVVDCGAPLLKANYARAYLDVNREPYELDPKMFKGRLPSFANTKSIRVNGGLGTIARNVSEKLQIYRGKLDVDEVISRIDQVYKPYHEELRRVLAKTYSEFGFAVLIDCHSMPSAKNHNQQDLRSDFVIGDRYGTSISGDYVKNTMEILGSMGYRVAVNKPYAGGFITEHYGRPKDGLYAMQIEINRGLYMDEQLMVKSDGFQKLQEDLGEFVRQLMMVSSVKTDGHLGLAAE